MIRGVYSYGITGNATREAERMMSDDLIKETESYKESLSVSVL